VVDELMSEQVREYLDGLVPERPDELQKMETYARQHSFPIIGPACGNICYQLARLAGVRQVCELGSGYGYSTAWFARAVKENGGGAVQHIVWDDDLSQAAKQHLEKLGYSDTVQYHVGEAVAVLRGMDGPFDIIFNDIDKEGYPDALPVIEQKLKPGGLLIIDNMLWHGRIFDPEDRAASTDGVREFTRLITDDDRWIVSLLPVRDGIIVATKR
jgi:predicted O-methyltransferase YrrM